MKKHYLVTITETCDRVYEIEAEDEDDAIEAAHEMKSEGVRPTYEWINDETTVEEAK